jgi:hypothetical protein
MRAYRRIDSIRKREREDINLGFERKDSLKLASETNFHAPVQVFAKVKPEYVTKLNDKQYCSACRTELMLLENTQKLLCRSCGNSISVGQNTPLLNTEQSLHPFGSQVKNEYDRPFMVGLVSSDDNDGNDGNNEVTYSSSDRRIMRIKLKKGLQNISEKDISKLD